MLKHQRAGIGIARACAAVLLAAGCAGGADATITFEPTKTLYDAEGARALLDQTDTSAFAKTGADEAPEMRRSRLVELRSRGDAAAAAATLITKVFPSDTMSVPVRVQTAAYDGAAALLVVEAYGDAAGKLSRKRLWVLDRKSGAILLAATAR